MSTDPYFPFTPDKWWPDLFEVLTRAAAPAGLRPRTLTHPPARPMRWGPEFSFNGPAA
ncbi:hypothetical protein [Actinomyces oricola]